MALNLESVTYSIKGHPLVNDISIKAHYGEVISILGANGAGKSTLMSLISGQKVATKGKIELDNIQLQDYSHSMLANKRAVLQQHNQISLNFNVKEVIMMGRYGSFKYSPRKKDNIAVEETMDFCGITHLAERELLTLSGGEQQRVHLARVLAQLWYKEKGLILLDEPISGMDIQYQQQTMALAAAMARQGFLVISVLHDINLAAQYSSRIIMLKSGRKLWDGNPVEVLTDRRIYNIFETSVRVIIDPYTLKPVVIPEEIVIQNISQRSKTEFTSR